MRYVKINGGTAIVKVEGRYDLCNTLDVMSTKVKVDLTNTTEIDSAAVKDLQKVRNRVRVENFEVYGAAGEVREKIKQAQLGG